MQVNTIFKKNTTIIIHLKCSNINLFNNNTKTFHKINKKARKMVVRAMTKKQLFFNNKTALMEMEFIMGTHTKLHSFKILFKTHLKVKINISKNRTKITISKQLRANGQ